MPGFHVSSLLLFVLVLLPQLFLRCLCLLVVLVYLHFPLHFLRRGFNVNLVTEVVLHDLVLIEFLVLQQVQCVVSLFRPVVCLVDSLLFLNIS